MAQTSREVISALFHRQKAERIGFYDEPWPDTIANWVKDGYPTRRVHKQVGDSRWSAEDGRAQRVEAEGDYEQPVPVWEGLHYDMECGLAAFDTLPIVGYEELVEETADWDIRRNGAGASYRRWKHKSGTPEHMDFRMTSREAWERDYRQHVVEWAPRRVNVAHMRAAWAAASRLPIWKGYGSVFVWENMRRSMGDIAMYTSLLDDPAWIHDYNRVNTDMIKRAYAYMFEQVGVPDSVTLCEDLGYRNGLVASPKTLAELIFPYFAEIISFFHGYGVQVILHSCGSVAEAMPMIVEVGFDGLHPMERKAAGNDPFVFAEKYGDKLVFIGGLDVRIFETNDKELIGREMVSFIEGMKARGARLIFASDHSVPTSVTYDTFLYIYQVYQEHMLY